MTVMEGGTEQVSGVGCRVSEDARRHLAPGT
jgi:hypothetical protein